MTIICPSCDEGELDVSIDYERQTYWYPGHLEVEIRSQSCSCNLEDMDDLQERLRERVREAAWIP